MTARGLLAATGAGIVFGDRGTAGKHGAGRDSSMPGDQANREAGGSRMVLLSCRFSSSSSAARLNLDLGSRRRGDLHIHLLRVHTPG